MQTYESDAAIGNIKILAVDMDKTLHIGRAHV